MRAVVVGAGAVGTRVARQLHATDGLEGLVIVDTSPARAEAAVAAVGAPAEVGQWGPEALDAVDVVVLASPGRHRAAAEVALEHGAHVVSVADSIEDVRSLLDLDAEARERALVVAVGAAFGPGLSCVLARHAAAGFDAIDEVHVARHGTGGPACARQHHHALAADAIDWRDGAWRRRPGGSGRELCSFPDPIGGVDCYRGGLPDALLLVPAFPGVQRVTGRVAATRRDRLTAHLPMLRRPHPEGAVGAIRVEVRGRRGTTSDVTVLGALDRPAAAAGAIAAVTAFWAADGRLARAGAAGLAELVDDAVPFLHDLAHRGVRAAVFEGVG
ncbi:MAG TPA: Gfo/Idh/MocA family oxidoreductase [Acidimicrobiales bacterium]|nr:Gfo/Idh/MocA family oxidoreductase [Acidimicrobiales bacterium]